MARFAPLGVKVVAITANLTAFGVFVFLLVRDLAPGEPLDLLAFVFGVVVFAVYCWTEFYWRPWPLRE